MLVGFALAVGYCVPSVSVRASAVYAASEPDETLSSKQAIRDAQQASRANLGTFTAGATSFTTDDGQVTLDGDGLFRLQVNERATRKRICVKTSQRYGMRLLNSCGRNSAS